MASVTVARSLTRQKSNGVSVACERWFSRKLRADGLAADTWSPIPVVTHRRPVIQVDSVKSECRCRSRANCCPALPSGGRRQHTMIRARRSMKHRCFHCWVPHDRDSTGRPPSFARFAIIIAPVDPRPAMLRELAAFMLAFSSITCGHARLFDCPNMARSPILRPR
jgi:hypothetical protein